MLDQASGSTDEGANAHGTALASVIAGNTESYQGIAPGCEILSYQVIDGSGLADSFTVATAVIAAVEDGAGVINLSLGAEQGSSSSGMRFHMHFLAMLSWWLPLGMMVWA